MVVRSGLSVFWLMEALSWIMLTDTARSFSFMPSRGAYRAARTRTSFRSNPSPKAPLFWLIKSRFTVEIEAYPFAGSDVTTRASQACQSKFLPNSRCPSGLLAARVLHPKEAPVIATSASSFDVRNRVTSASEEAPP